MAARNKARKRAFQILFEAEQRGAEPVSVMADWIRLARTDERQPQVTEYTMQLVEGYAAHAGAIDELLAEHAVGGFSNGGECLGQQVIERLPVRVTLPELVGHRPQFLVGHRDEVVLDGVDLLADPLQLAQDLSFARAKDAI